MNHPITIGTRVEFDSEVGLQRGTVLNVPAVARNAVPHALIQVDHALSGIHWSVELHKLTALSTKAVA